MTMLHIELLGHNATGSVWWHTGDSPEHLKDPTAHLRVSALRKGEIKHFDLDEYDGKSYRPTEAKETAPCPICGDMVYFVHAGGDAFNATEESPEGTITLACRCSMPRSRWEQALEAHNQG